MSNTPQNSTEISLDGATVPFYEYNVAGVEYIQFDTSRSGHPEPMVNAMVGLQNLKSGQKLVMINSKPPAGLFPKIENDFSYEVEQLGEGLYKIVFTARNEAASNTNFTDTACHG